MSEPTEQEQPQNALAEKWRGLVHHTIRRHVLPIISAERLAEIGGQDELVASGFLKLVQLTRAFDAARISPKTGRPVAFSTFAMIGPRRHFLQVLTWRRPFERLRPIEYGDEDHGECNMIPATIGDVADLAAADETAEEVAKAIRRLPKRYRQMMRLRYRDGMSFEEIGRVMGVSRSRIGQIHEVAVRKLREHFGSNGRTPITQRRGKKRRATHASPPTSETPASP